MPPVTPSTTRRPRRATSGLGAATAALPTGAEEPELATASKGRFGAAIGRRLRLLGLVGFPGVGEQRGLGLSLGVFFGRLGDGADLARLDLLEGDRQGLARHRRDLRGHDLAEPLAQLVVVVVD